MTNRRQFLQTAAALTAAPLAGRASFASTHKPTSFAAVIVDSRYAEARAFGARATPLGAPVREIEGDITDLWQNELLGHWKNSRAAVVGLTERPALFLLENLAWEHGLRVVFEAEHEPAGEGNAIHNIIRSADPALALSLTASGSSWPGILADALIAGNLAPKRDFRPSSAGLATHLGEAQKLYSWIIAPRTAV
ncbi:MAG: twin-arginine translocation signal domain-containing protein [Pseudomonadota bacterium]